MPQQPHPVQQVLPTIPPFFIRPRQAPDGSMTFTISPWRLARRWLEDAALLAACSVIAMFIPAGCSSAARSSPKVAAVVLLALSAMAVFFAWKDAARARRLTIDPAAGVAHIDRLQRLGAPQGRITVPIQSIRLILRDVEVMTRNPRLIGFTEWKLFNGQAVIVDAGPTPFTIAATRSAIDLAEYLRSLPVPLSHMPVEPGPALAGLGGPTIS